MRQAGIPVAEVSPSRGKAGAPNDKLARVNAVAPILEDGVVWAPDKRWAHELIEECAEFPVGNNDDMVDITQMALARFRQGGFLSLKSDKDIDDDELIRRPRRTAYY
jgi:phage terminase large subunit-like protein